MNLHPCNPLPEIEYKDQSGSVGGGVEVGTLDPATSVCGGATKHPGAFGCGESIKQAKSNQVFWKISHHLQY